MEEHSYFIWQLIEQTPVLSQKIQNLDTMKHQNDDQHVAVYIDFFKDLELTLEEIITSFQIPSHNFYPQPTKLLN